tara:strand:- start:18171 stop:18341 length:171 start_codon:yes stop_codon:yes gene_type:complete
MGEAKRRKDQGLAPKTQKKSRPDSSNLFSRYPMMPYFLIASFIIFLIVDLVKYYGS